MNQTVVEQGSRIVRNMTMRGPPPSLWRDPLFGVIPVFMIWNMVIVILVILVFWWLIRGSYKSKTPLDLLKKRYVAGEIDRETYLKMKEDITD